MDINTWVVSGRLTRDAEKKTMPSGATLVSFSIACNTGTGDYARTTFVNCKSFTKQGVALMPYLLKAQKVCVTGAYENNSWTDKEGNQRDSLELGVRDIVLLDSSTKKTETKELFEEDRPVPKPKAPSGPSSWADDYNSNYKPKSQLA